MIDPNLANTLREIPAIIAAVGACVAVVLGGLNKIQIGKVKKTGEDTHKLTNSAMAEQLRSSIADKTALAVVLHSIAAKSDMPSDLEAAEAMDVRVEAAKTLYQEHMRNQAKVDARAEVEQ